MKINAVRNRKAPANDRRPHVVREMPRVFYAPSFFGKKKIAALIVAVFGVFTVSFAGAMLKMSVSGAEAERPGFDIVLSSAAPAPQNDDDELSNNQNTLPPAFEVTVSDDAGDYATVAQRMLRQGDVDQAVRYQRLAVARHPQNMFYRFELAVMHDRLSDKQGAAVLYRQVVRAYDNRDKTLPKKFDIEGVRRRLAYLESTAP